MMKNDDRPIVAITAGDPAGIGPEIIVMTLSRRDIYEKCRPVVIGERKLMERALKIVKSPLKINVISHPSEGRYEYGVIDLIDLGNIEDLDRIGFGRPSAEGGRASIQFIETATKYAMNGDVDAIATAPINKKSLALAGSKFVAHTEMLKELTGAPDVAMLLIGDSLRVAHVTTHVAFKDVPKLLTKERIIKVVKLFHEALIDLGIENPRIAVAGLNPHAGEDGLFGREEIDVIKPAVEELQKEGINVRGPFPPDTVFVRTLGGEFDGVVAMYHDQGHIPVKLIGFRVSDPTRRIYSKMSGVNITLGLPIIRVSVDHGTAYGKAGKGTANPESMIEAVEIAARMASSRKKRASP